MRKVTCSALLICALSLVAACDDAGDDDGGSTATSPTATTTTSPTATTTPASGGVDVTALTATTVCDAIPVTTISSITQHQVSDSQGEVGACNWMAPEAVRVRLYPPAEWEPSGDSGYRELSGIGTKAYIAEGSFGNGYVAEALLADRAVAAIIPADWATEEMTIDLLRVAVESLG